MKISKIICKHCKKVITEIPTPHGIDSHGTCTDCEEIENEIWK